jgi:phytanoyl-CoA dioxygenase PhyH
MNYALSETEREQYRRQGYFIRRGLVPPEEVAALKADIQQLVEQAAASNGPEVSWINKEKRIPERLHLLLRPGWIRPSFAASLESGPYFPIVEQLLGGPARYSLFGMLAGGDGKPYIQNWHRDVALTEGERELLVLERGYRTVVQINAPLYPDRFLQIIPGSHLRPTTQPERDVLANAPTGEMPGQLVVEMEPGDVIFYYPNLLHRGYNPVGALRWTMCHAFVAAAAPVYSHERGQEGWIAQPGYLASLPPRLRLAMQRYLDALPAGPSPVFAAAMAA